MRRRRKLLVCGLLLGLFTLLAGAGQVRAADPAELSLDVQSRPNGTVLLTATVTDASRAPVQGTMVTIQVKTTFGRLVVAEMETDRLGRVVVLLPQMPRSGEITAEAESGTQTLHAATWIDRTPPPSPQTRPGYNTLSAVTPQPGFISPYPVPLEVMLLAVVLGGIWMTYVYLVSMLVNIRRAPTRVETRGTQWR